MRLISNGAPFYWKGHNTKKSNIINPLEITNIPGELYTIIVPVLRWV